MPDPPHPRGVIDTSVVIEMKRIDAEHLPVELAISTATLAELAAGPHAATSPGERARRQELLQRVEFELHALPLDAAVARAYGRAYAAAAAVGRKPRGRRSLDLLIAATALAAMLPLYTCDPGDFRGLESLLEIVAIEIPT